MSTHSNRSVHRPAAVILVAILGLLVTFGGGATAGAGGWAVTTLDSLPAPTAGSPVEVGFTIRQHGVTPVDLDGVVVEVMSATGQPSRFPAVQRGATGHHVASVTFPDAGTYEWRVHQGWFGPQELGTLSVAEAPSQPASSGEHRYPAPVRFGVPVIAALFAAVAIADVLAGVRRRRSVAV